MIMSGIRLGLPLEESALYHYAIRTNMKCTDSRKIEYKKENTQNGTVVISFALIYKYIKYINV